MGVQGSSLVPILPGFQVNFFECANELIFGYFVCFYIRLEKEARVAGQPVVNLLGTRTYKHNHLRASGPRIGLSL